MSAASVSVCGCVDVLRRKDGRATQVEYIPKISQKQVQSSEEECEQTQSTFSLQGVAFRHIPQVGSASSSNSGNRTGRDPLKETHPRGIRGLEKTVIYAFPFFPLLEIVLRAIAAATGGATLFPNASRRVVLETVTSSVVTASNGSVLWQRNVVLTGRTS